MNRLNLTQRTPYKQRVIDRFLASDVLLQALAKEGEAPSADAARQRIFPYRFTELPLQEPDCCISVDIVTAKSSTASMCVNQLFVWICCHKSLFSGDGYETRADRLAQEADRLLNGSADFGIGRLLWEGMQLYEPTPEYYGYVLQYAASDFIRKRN